MAEPLVFIPLSQGKVAVIDFADFELVRPFKWSAMQAWNKKTWYASRNNRVSRGKWASVKLHGWITGWVGVDHRNGNGLDNRRCNLRQFSQAQNLRSLISKRNRRSSNYRGVQWYNPSPTKWRACITVNYRNIHLGYYDIEEDAARAYDAAAKAYGFPEEALNFPPPRPDDWAVL